MNNIIISVIAFSVGLIVGMVFFACSTKAFEFEENSGTRWNLMMQRQQLQRIEEEQQRQQQMNQERTQRRNPC